MRRLKLEDELSMLCYNKRKHPSAMRVITEEINGSAECDLHLRSPPPLA